MAYLSDDEAPVSVSDIIAIMGLMYVAIVLTLILGIALDLDGVMPPIDLAYAANFTA